jgi:dienelactone hydrolase
MKKLIAIILFCLFTIVPAHAEVITSLVFYQAGDAKLRGYLAYDDQFTGKRPGILVVHEWWGHNEYARKRARMLAELGYTALAVDMYGEGKTADHPDDAGKFASAVMQNMATTGKERFMAALDVLKKHPSVDTAKIAAIGYCFGGGTVLNMARLGVDLKGVVSFHGSLGTATPASPGQVNANVLVANGESDSFVTPEQVAEFKKEMEQAGVDYQFINYPGAKHSFTNPDADSFAQRFGMDIAYNAEADKKSWEDMQAFFNKIFADQQ